MSINKKNLVPDGKSADFTFQDFRNVVENLHAKDGGCAWDSVQTFESLKPHLMEEVEELFAAIDKKDYVNICEELGDILFITLLYSEIADSEKLFSIDEVIDCGARKMTGRHPQIFGGASFSDREEFKKFWADQKAKEKLARREKLEARKAEKYGD